MWGLPPKPECKPHEGRDPDAPLPAGPSAAGTGSARECVLNGTLCVDGGLVRLRGSPQAGWLTGDLAVLEESFIPFLAAEKKEKVFYIRK